MEHLNNIVSRSHRGIAILASVSLILASLGLYKIYVLNKQLIATQKILNQVLTGELPEATDNNKEIHIIPGLINAVNSLSKDVNELKAKLKFK